MEQSIEIVHAMILDQSLACVINIMGTVNVKLLLLADNVTAVLQQHSGSVALGVSGVTVIISDHKMSFVIRLVANVHVTPNSQHLAENVMNVNLDFGTFLTVRSVSVTITPKFVIKTLEYASTADSTQWVISVMNVK